MMNTQTESEAKDRITGTQRWRNALSPASLGPWIIVLAGAMMCWISWLKWPDLVIDFGEQLYIAWRLSEGEVLYRDIVYFYGPLSSYIHAFLFKLFGPQLIVLVVFNLVLVAALTLMIYRLFLYMGSPLSAMVAGLTFLTVFAFAQYLWMGNHNFICSYVYDVTHGIFLSFLAAGQFVRFVKTQDKRQLILLGLFSGLVLLTKFEVSLAWTVAVFSGLAMAFKIWNWNSREWLHGFAWFFLGLFLPFLMFTLYFSYHMGLSRGLQVMLGPWTYIFTTSIGSLPFYKSVMGTDALGANLVSILKYLVAWALLLVSLAALNHTLRKPLARSPLIAIFAILLFLSGLQHVQSSIPWLELLKPLPFILLGWSVFLGFRLWKADSEPFIHLPHLVLATLTLFSLVLLLKIFFNTHVYHYGTALAMPATLIFFKILVDDLPGKLKKFSGTYLFFKGTMVAGIFFFIYNHFLVSSGFYAKKVFPVASGGDSMISYHPEIAPRGLFIQIALDILGQEMKEGQTLATFPTGAMLNYLLRKKNSVDTISYNPGTWKLIGEQRVLNNLRAAPPSFIAIVYHDYLEFGHRFFGKDFGKEIYQWILEDYSSFKIIGRDPLRGEGFGIHLFKLKNPASPPSSLIDDSAS